MATTHSRARGLFPILPAVPLLLAIAAVPPASAQLATTAAEESGFSRYTSHDEMMAFLLALRASSPDIRLGAYGESREGRELPYAILSRPLVSQPREAELLGRPVVLLAANVHGAERTLRESLLLLLRELATPGTPENRLLDEMVIIVAPQLNPDGFHAGERGTRGNAWGVDLNRDYIRLSQPETRGYVALLQRWNPHLFVDGHDGGSLPYNVAYQCPSHASSAPAITRLCDEELFPFIDRALEAEGYRSWYYSGGTETRWHTGGFQARIGRNYGGLANMVGVLFESPPRQAVQTGVHSGFIAYGAVLEYVRQNVNRVVATVQQARRETLARQLDPDVVVDMRYGPEHRRVTYEIALDDDRGRRYVQVTSDSLMKRPVPTQVRPRPFAYVLPREATAAVALLRRHGVTVEQLRDSVLLDVQAYTVGAVEHTRQYEHAAAVRVRPGEVVTVRRTFPAGTFVVPTAQVQGRIVAHMLEPETDDNVIYWNTMDALLPRPETAVALPPDPDEDEREPGRPQGPPLVPIFKLMTPQPLPASIIE
jgi:hypothetical protein